MSLLKQKSVRYKFFADLYFHRLIPEILICYAIRLAEVTVEVLFSEMAQKVIVVEEAIVTKLAEWMTFV